MSYYCYKSTGSIVYDPKKDTKWSVSWWANLTVDMEIVRLYRWFLLRHGIHTIPNKLFGPHISVVKGEEPLCKEKWGRPRTVVFYYTNQIRYDNGMHAWLDVWSSDLADFRTDLGLSPKPKFHITLGRWGEE